MQRFSPVAGWPGALAARTPADQQPETHQGRRHQHQCHHPVQVDGKGFGPVLSRPGQAAAEQQGCQPDAQKFGSGAAEQVVQRGLG